MVAAIGVTNIVAIVIMMSLLVITIVAVTVIMGVTVLMVTVVVRAVMLTGNSGGGPTERCLSCV